MMGKLSRTILWETTRLFCFYGGAYLVLICIAVATPLVREGAPLIDVLLFLPNQLAFPASLALPLALVTATLSCLARMREDGELTALMAAGVSPVRVARATLPLALAMALVSGWMAHVLLPFTHLNFARAKSSLLRQAMATKVARQEPIFQQTDEHGLTTTVLTAQSATGERIGQVFGWQTTETGEVYLAYAPQAVWHSEEEIQRVVRAGLSEEEAGRFEQVAATILAGVEDKLGDELDEDLARTIQDALRLSFENATRKEDERVISRLNLQLHEGRLLSYTQEPPPLPPQLVQLEALGQYRRVIPDHDIPHPIVGAEFGRWSIELEHIKGRSNPPEVKTTAALAKEIDGLALILGRFDVAQLPAAYRDGLVRDARRRLVEHRYVYHLRWVMTAAVLCYWLLACGLALVVPARNRLVAVFVGLVAVIGTLMPAIAIIKGVAEHLPVHPGLVLWTPPVAMGLLGLALLWWKR